MKVMEFTGHQLATSGIYDTALAMPQQEINALLMAGGGAGSLDALYAMIARAEASRTAQRAHAAGSYLVVEKKLFRATEDIPAGAAIRPGDNAVQTTILDAMRDLFRIVRTTDGSPRCDQTVGVDYYALCGIMHWDSAAFNALTLSDEEVFGG